MVHAVASPPAGAAGYRIPFNRPTLVGNESSYVAEALAGGHLAGDGPFTKKCQAWLERHLGAHRVLLTTSGTHALEMAALLLDMQPGDEVVLPSFTFVSGANAFVLRGARPVFIDVRADTLNFDEAQAESLITPRTKALAPVHYAGVACAMDPILALAHRRGLGVVEDNAHGLFGEYRGRPLGTLGDLGVLSFHETKNVTCGEGGALLINDERYVELAEIIRQKGTDRQRFFRGQVDKYTWVHLGSSYVLSELLAAFLYGQLEAWESVQAQRRRIWDAYRTSLQDWAEEHAIRLPVVPEDIGRQAYHMFYLILPSLAARESLIRHLRSQGILSVFHYTPLHLSAMGRRWGYRQGQLPVTEWVCDRLLRLPFYTGLTQDDQREVIDAVRSWRL